MQSPRWRNHLIQHNEQDPESEEQTVPITDNEASWIQPFITKISQPDEQPVRPHHQNNYEAQNNQIVPHTTPTKIKNQIWFSRHTRVDGKAKPTSTRKTTPPENSQSRTKSFQSLLLQFLRQTLKPKQQKHQTHQNLSERLVRTLWGTVCVPTRCQQRTCIF